MDMRKAKEGGGKRDRWTVRNRVRRNGTRKKYGRKERKKTRKKYGRRARNRHGKKERKGRKETKVLGKKECKKQSWREIKNILEVDAIADGVCSFVACW